MKPSSSFSISTLALIGPGLIGGSLAAALKAAGVVQCVVGVGRDANSLRKAQDLGLIDTQASVADAAAKADVIVLATPVRASAALFREIYPHLKPTTVITDVGSTKADVVSLAQELLKEHYPRFVPGHPIAGAEKTGPEAARDDLYQDRNIVLTPTPETDPIAQQLITQMWLHCGARVLLMEPAEHDEVLASVSHVPHFLSAVFMWQVASAENADLRLNLAGSGFRDFTRIAAGSSEVWRDIFLSNKQAVLNELREVREAFAQAEQALLEGDEESLYDFLERAALARRLWASRSGYHE
ncbi:MAG TPA: prephenate dehydrogenase/arogenate dehydrogenase family protein [Paenalcaligenes sp.]|nr:prephenate dehydrogenase/arogenate dehydrogenase family protein [Paenalcaligenes sp.]